MKLLSQSKHTDLVYLIKDSHYQWLYSRITQILDARDASFFSSIEMRQSDARWYATGENDYVSFDKASDDDKDQAIDELEYLRSEIKRKFETDPQLSTYKDNLLIIPNENCIFLYKDNKGQTKVILTQWGCKNPRSKMDFNPIGKIVNTPRPNRTKVEVLVKWSDGEMAANKTFWFFNQYQGRQVSTDKESRIYLGVLKNGIQFTIADTNDRSGFEETLEVIPDQNLYTIVFPYFTSAEVMVINQLDQPVTDCEIKAVHNEEENVYKSDENGKFNISKILYNNKPLILTLNDNDEVSHEYTLERDTNKLKFKIHQTITRNPKIRVINKKDNTSVSEYTVKVKISENSEADKKSDLDGFIVIPNIELDTKIIITDSNDKYNNKEYIVRLDENEFLFPVELPEEKFVRIKLLNLKGDFMPDHPIDVIIHGKVYNKTTDSEGYVTFPQKMFKHGKKIKVEIPLIENE